MLLNHNQNPTSDVNVNVNPNQDVNANQNPNQDASCELDTLITPHIAAGQLPQLLEQVLLTTNHAHMRDMLLLSCLTNLGYTLPAMRCYHGMPRHEYGPELMTMVLAPAASGKGVMNYGRRLLSAIEGEQGKLVYIPANASASALIALMQHFEGRGIIMATEMDTLSQTLRSSYGQFSDVIRCLFEHETVSMLRRASHEFIEIRDPHVSMLLSGTLNQLTPLIRSRENGLMSRFACYVVNERLDFDDEVWEDSLTPDPSPVGEGSMDPKTTLRQLTEEIGERYLWMKSQNHTCRFCLTEAQRVMVKRMFRSEYDNYSGAYPLEFDQTLKRMPVIMKRIGMILTGLRLSMSQPMPEVVYCSDDDFKTLMLIGHKLLLHAAMTFEMLPELKHQQYSPVSGSLQARQFFDMLPREFSKSLAVQSAESIGLSVGTMSNWLSFWTKSGVLQTVRKGEYVKCA